MYKNISVSNINISNIINLKEGNCIFRNPANVHATHDKSAVQRENGNDNHEVLL